MSCAIRIWKSNWHTGGLTMNDFVETHHAIGEQLDVINVNRSGALNKALIERLTAESNSDDWEEAKHEWRATGNTWYIPLRDSAGGRLPPEHLSKHPHHCICGHEIAWHFEIENTVNGKLEILGSEHITNWMIIRHLIENKGLDPETITEELIQEWKKDTQAHNWKEGKERCTFCNRYGHDSNDCYVKKKYGGHKSCSNCGKKGHFRSECD